MGKQVLCLVAVVLFALTITPQCQGVRVKVEVSWRQNGQVVILGHSCHYNQVKSDDTYRGIIICPGWTSVTGEAVTTDGSKVKNDTIADFVQKALEAGVITETVAKELTQ